ncbi:MAG TPA: hypothetical protein VK608_07740, partial [Edaphobacter sp.]|nr:hypothetical protein [Edaphobacter sp.]
MRAAFSKGPSPLLLLVRAVALAASPYLLSHRYNQIAPPNIVTQRRNPILNAATTLTLGAITCLSLHSQIP